MRNSLLQSLQTSLEGLSVGKILLPRALPALPAFSMPETIIPLDRTPKKVQCNLPAVLMRAGTSKGLFIHRHHLPSSQRAWTGPLLAAMGSNNSDPRQIDGVGGATSTTSKVAVVSPSSRPGIDVDYTFVQVAVGQEEVDFSGNCGNMCSGVGPFALQEGLVQASPGEQTLDVRIFNTKTSRVVVDTIQVDADGSFNEDGNFRIPGVKGTGSEIKVAFVDPAGSMTGNLFPTARRTDTITVEERNGPRFSVKATLIDAANPFIFVDASSLPGYLKTCDKKSTGYLEHMESIRRAGAVAMGLATSTMTAAKVRGTPKIAIVSPASPSLPTTEGVESSFAKIHVQAFSMGKLHPSLQLTGAACLATAVSIEGTVAHRIASMKEQESNWTLPTPERTPSPCSETEEALTGRVSASCLLPEAETVRISHESGFINVEVVSASSAAFAVVDRCIVSRTARRLFKGNVYYNQEITA